MHAVLTRSRSTRFAWAVALALLLVIRVVTSAGYMPDVEQGHLTLMLCPDGEWTVPSTTMPGMPHDGSKGIEGHQQCPFAAAAAMPLSNTAPAPLVAPVALPLVLAGAPIISWISARPHFARPPSTGPPFPA